MTDKLDSVAKNTCLCAILLSLDGCFYSLSYYLCIQTVLFTNVVLKVPYYLLSFF